MNELLLVLSTLEKYLVGSGERCRELAWMGISVSFQKIDTQTSVKYKSCEHEASFKADGNQMQHSFIVQPISLMG